MEVFAKIGLIGGLSLLLIIHSLVLVRLLPFSIVWGGTLQSAREMYPKQGLALGMTSLFLWVALESTLSWPGWLPAEALPWLLWLMVGLFSLSTLGNILSKSPVEKYLFSVLSILMVTCCLILLLNA
ncbi:MAG: hypothetical protein AAFU60_11240 [Bacteroidota bacterium]